MAVDIADVRVDDPHGAVVRWLTEHDKTVRGYDQHTSQHPDRITARDVLATQYTKLRVDGMELQFFLDRGRSAPWHLVPADATLAAADPEEEGGLYDAAEELYGHFYRGRLRGLAIGKIHRVLHLKRRHLFPLLDGRLLELYKDAATEASRRFRDHGRRGRRGRLYWVAIRDDILAAGDLWDDLRANLATSDGPAALGAELSDVRLHDILCWEAVRR
ncbi:MAG: DUF6308 family protein [Actinomycetota bacterium]|nr:DUF6308 family protein [Actinomycetota bacterium]